MPARERRKREFCANPVHSLLALRLESLAMIAHLRGTLIAKGPSHAIVEAAGVGYELAISITTYSDLPALNAEIALHVYTHVREDALALFGFLQRAEKQLFEKLIGVS